MKLKLSLLFVGLAFLFCCVTSNQAKVYEDGLAQLVGKDLPEVVDRIVQTWEFKPVDQWDAKNPTAEAVLKKNFRTHGFSKEEAQTIFAAEGAYKAIMFQKQLAQEAASTGGVDEMGLPQLDQQKHMSIRFGYIRVVFKDGKLAHYRVWS